jgi:hypothetical protein
MYWRINVLQGISAEVWKYVGDTLSALQISEKLMTEKFEAFGNNPRRKHYWLRNRETCMKILGETRMSK